MLLGRGRSRGWLADTTRGRAIDHERVDCGISRSLGRPSAHISEIEKLSDGTRSHALRCHAAPATSNRRMTDLSADIRTKLEKFRYGMAVFKVDYALSSPIPWKAKDCLRAATVHLGGTAEEIGASECCRAQTESAAERPFVLLAQPSLFRSEPRAGREARGLGLLPYSQRIDGRYARKIENQIERFAPGFRDCVLARRRSFSRCAGSRWMRTSSAATSTAVRWTAGQFLFRPTSRHYATSSSEDLYMLVVHAAGWRRPRHVWVPRGKARTLAIALEAKFRILRDRLFADLQHWHRKRTPVRIRDFHSHSWASAPFWK